MRQIGAFRQPTGAVVVGCDGSAESRNAVAAGALEASLRGVELVLLGVVKHQPGQTNSVHDADSSYPTDSSQEADPSRHADPSRPAGTAADDAQAHVDASHPGLASSALTVHELDSPELADLARRAGLLVLGRRGNQGRLAFTIGSMSAELARRFHCPMLVVHEQVQDPTHEGSPRECAVVVGLDVPDKDTPEMGRVGSADPVLAMAVTEAVVRGLPLLVVHTLQRGQDVGHAAMAESWHRCRTALNQAQLPADVANRLVIIEDDPVAALLRRVGSGDLLVVGTHGQGRLAGLVRGSVSRGVLDRMTCNVMVVQPSLLAAAPVPTAFTPNIIDTAAPVLTDRVSISARA